MRRRLVPGALLVAAVVLAGAVAVARGGGEGGSGTAHGTRASAGMTVEPLRRRTLVDRLTVDGTLGYASQRSVVDRLGGTITWLPSIGTVIRAGQRLFEVDAEPVVLMDGTVPAWRTLAPGVSDGKDVRQLERNLAAFGDDPGAVDDHFDAATEAAVRRWQDDLDLPQTGTVELGRVVFLPGPRRVSAISATLGSSAGGGSDGRTAVAAPGADAGLRIVPIADVGRTPADRAVGGSRGTAPAGGPRIVPIADAAAPTPQGPTGGSGATGPQGTAPRGGTGPQGATAPAESAPPRERTSSGTRTPSRGSTGARAPHARTTPSPQASAGGRGTSAGAAAGDGEGAASPAGTPSGRDGSADDSSSGSGGGGGGAPATAVMTTTSTGHAVTAEVDAADQGVVTHGQRVVVELPGGRRVRGRVSAVGTTASSDSGDGGDGGGIAGGGSDTPTVSVRIALDAGARVGRLDQAPVSVLIERAVRRRVFAVPVAALMARTGGGYAIQVAATSGARLVPVEPGLFADGYVEVDGRGLRAGLRVEVPR